MLLHHLPCYLVLFVTRILLVSSNQTYSLQEAYSEVLANITRINSVLKDLLRNYDELKKIQIQKLSAETLSIEDPPSVNNAKGYESAPNNINKKSDTVPTQMPFESREKTGNLESIKEEAFKIHNDNQDKKTAHDVIRSRQLDRSMENKPIHVNIKRTVLREKNNSSSNEESAVEDSGTHEESEETVLRKRVTSGLSLRSGPENRVTPSPDEETLWYKILKNKLQQLAKIEQIVKEPQTLNKTPLEPRIEGMFANSAIHGDRRDETHRVLDTSHMDKPLRSEFGDACIKVVIKKCYLALCGALDKYCAKKLNCEDEFKENFKKCSRRNCISYFEGTSTNTATGCDSGECGPQSTNYRTSEFLTEEKGNYNEPYEKVHVKNETNPETAKDQRITAETQNMELNLNEIKQQFYNETFENQTLINAQPLKQQLAYKEDMNRKPLKHQFYNEKFEANKTKDIQIQTDKIETLIHAQPLKQEPAKKEDNMNKIALAQELDDLLNKIQNDSNRTSLDKRVFKDIQTQPVKGAENLFKSQNADKEIEPRFVEKVPTSEKVLLQTEKTTPLTLVKTADDYLVFTLRDHTLQQLEEECAKISVSKCVNACTKAVMNSAKDSDQQKDFIDHCEPQCSTVYIGGGEDSEGESSDSNESDSDSNSEGSNSDSD